MTETKKDQQGDLFRRFRSNPSPQVAKPTRDAAYNLEAQAICVAQAQEHGQLIEIAGYFEGLEIRREETLRWYVMHGGGLHGGNFFAEDCDEGVIELLRSGESLLTIIQTPETHPDIFDRRNFHAIAAVLYDSQTVYKSPGFNLEAYLETKQPIQKRMSLRERLAKLLGV